jgi:Holliday junction resolvase RusA-like endonuclease
MISGFTLHINGRPIGKGRPRFAHGRTYTPHQTTVAEEAIRGEWEANGAPRLPDGPVRLHVVLGVERPQSHFLRDGSLSAEGQRNRFPHRQKPDLDNATKLIMDALNGRSWRDDVQVIALVAERVWCERAFTMVTASVATGNAMRR